MSDVIDFETRDRIGADNLANRTQKAAPRKKPAPPESVPRQKRRGNYKTWQPTNSQRRLVAVGMAAGLGVMDVAKAIGVDRRTLEKHCADELTGGEAAINSKVASKLFNRCMKGDTIALIFWAKSRLGWNEKQRIEHTGADGGPIAYETVDAEAAAFTSRIQSLAERFMPAEPPQGLEGANDAPAELTQKSTAQGE